MTTSMEDQRATGRKWFSEILDRHTNICQKLRADLMNSVVKQGGEAAGIGVKQSL